MNTKYCTDKRKDAVEKIVQLVNEFKAEDAFNYFKSFSKVRRKTLLRDVTSRKISAGVYLQTVAVANDLI